jgi:hypothetical protein
MEPTIRIISNYQSTRETHIRLERLALLILGKVNKNQEEGSLEKNILKDNETVVI